MFRGVPRGVVLLVLVVAALILYHFNDSQHKLSANDLAEDPNQNEQTDDETVQMSPPNKTIEYKLMNNREAIAYARTQYDELNRQNKTTAVGYGDPRVPPEIEQMRADDPKLLELIRNIWIDPPSTEDYHLYNPSAFQSQFREDVTVRSMLEEQRDGFFVEAGAADGETISTTLSFERAHNWTGLLVEADPIAYMMLTTKHRKAYSINACLNSEVSKSQFDATFLGGGVDGIRRIPKEAYRTTVYCFPLHSILQAINQTRVDFFSLDVEGAEPYVLKGIDFTKVDIRVISAEANHCGHEAIERVLVPAGYKFARKQRINDIYVKVH
ncbi:hypothetical protein ScPMuIL_010136 [Solemya velum]